MKSDRARFLAILLLLAIPASVWATVYEVPIASKPEPLRLGATVAMDGKLYKYGGYSESFYEPNSAKGAVYDPATNLWTPIHDMPDGGAGQGAFALNHKIYSVGGEGPYVGQFNSSVWCYPDPSPDAWATKTNFPQNIWFPQATVCNGTAYVFGGFPGYGYTLADTYQYNESSDTWTKKADMYQSTHKAGTVVHDGKIWAFGGCSGCNICTPGTVFKKTIQVYDPVTDRWSYYGEMPRLLNDVGAVLYNNEAWCFSASLVVDDQGNTIKNEYVDVFSFATETWRQEVFSYSTPFSGFSAQLIGHSVYFTDTNPGGSGGDTSTYAFRVDIPEPDTDQDGVGDTYDSCPDTPQGERANANGCSCSQVPPCNDGLFCNGAETCVEGMCQPGTPPCTEGQVCDEASDICVYSGNIWETTATITSPTPTGDPLKVTLGTPIMITVNVKHTVPWSSMQLLLGSDVIECKSFDYVAQNHNPGDTEVFTVFDAPSAQGTYTYQVKTFKKPGCDKNLEQTVDVTPDLQVVECLETADCPSGQVCIRNTHTCTECLDDEDCDDGDPCTTDTCATDFGVCQSTPVECPGGQTCNPGTGECVECVNDSDCNDGNACTDDACVNHVCQHTNNTATCDDGNPCTVNDTCSSGTCAGSPKACPPGGVCDPATGSCIAMADLAIIEFNAPDTAVTDEQIQVTWTVQNVGVGSAIGTWHDSVYLSADQVIDGSDRLLVSPDSAAESPLAPNGHYQRVADVRIPWDLPGGNYYLIAKTDATEVVPEDNSTNNLVPR